MTVTAPIVSNFNIIFLAFSFPPDIILPCICWFLETYWTSGYPHFHYSIMEITHFPTILFPLENPSSSPWAAAPRAGCFPDILSTLTLLWVTVWCWRCTTFWISQGLCSLPPTPITPLEYILTILSQKKEKWTRRKQGSWMLESIDPNKSALIFECVILELFSVYFWSSSVLQKAFLFRWSEF